MESVTDKIEDTLKEFEGDYDIDELRFMRIKFISEVASYFFLETFITFVLHYDVKYYYSNL
jgi:hypothetical protein